MVFLFFFFLVCWIAAKAGLEVGEFASREISVAPVSCWSQVCHPLQCSHRLREVCSGSEAFHEGMNSGCLLSPHGSVLLMSIEILAACFSAVKTQSQISRLGKRIPPILLCSQEINFLKKPVSSILSGVVGIGSLV